MQKLEELVAKKQPYTALFYCSTGVGKTTTAGLIAERAKVKPLSLMLTELLQQVLAKAKS